MAGEPKIVDRVAQPYVGIKALVTMQTIPHIADRLGEVFEWLEGNGIQPVSAPFLKYNVIDMEHQLEVECGVPVTSVVTGAGDIRGGILPAGRYVTVTHLGHPDGLLDVTTRLLEWAADQDLEWDMHDTDDGQRWGCRLEIYHTNPAVQPDMAKWETELAFRLAG